MSYHLWIAVGAIFMATGVTCLNIGMARRYDLMHPPKPTIYGASAGDGGFVWFTEDETGKRIPHGIPVPPGKDHPND